MLTFMPNCNSYSMVPLILVEYEVLKWVVFSFCQKWGKTFDEIIKRDQLTYGA